MVNEDFREALTCLFEEKRMARAAWRDISFVVMMPALNLPPNSRQEPGAKVNDRTAKHIGVDTPLNSQPYFAAFYEDGRWQPGWTPTVEDIFAEDWYCHDHFELTEDEAG
jgi:hypothetical protein